MDEDGGDAKESEVTRDRQGGVAVHLHRSRLQPLPIAKPDGQSMTSDFETGQLIASHAIQNHFRAEPINAEYGVRRQKKQDFQQAVRCDG